MKKNLARVIAVILSAALIAGTEATYYVRADKNDLDNEASKVLSYVHKNDHEAATWRDETVYVINDSNGENEKKIVVDKVKNNEDGTESVSKKQSDAEMPVDVRVTYELDGKEVKAEELAGRTGHVKIIYDYENKRFETVKIGGKDEKVYVPFIAVTGMLLDGDKFSNITVDGGKLIEEGARKAVVGAAFPGLNESLGNVKQFADTVSVPEKLVVEADVKDFELESVYTLVTNYSFDEFNVDENGLENSISDAMKSASDAFGRLVDGSAKIYEGLVSAKDGSEALTEGSKVALAGAKKLSDGAAALDAGAQQLAGGMKEAHAGSKQLSDGAAQLAAGLDALANNSAAINGGAEQVFEGLLANASKGLTDAGIQVPALTPDNYGEVLDGIVSQLTAAPAEGAAKAQMEAAAAMIANVKKSLDDYNTFYQGIKAYTAGVDAADRGAADLSSGAGNLCNGLGQLGEGAGALAAGTGELSDGATALSEGLGTLAAGEEKLDDGLAELRDGAGALNEGLNRVNDELIVKLEKLADTDLVGITDRLKALKQVSADYKGLDMPGEVEDGKVKFIYKNEAVRIAK